MLTSLPLVLLIIVLLLALFVATRPATFRVARSISIAAPADVAYGFVNDFRQWREWSPFEKFDPDMQRSFSGAAAGVGAGYAWSGNSRAGAGAMSLRENRPYERIVIDIRFDKPFKASNVAEFTFVTVSGGVTATWALSGDNTTVGKLMSLVMSMEKFLGPQFEDGLASLKRVSEAEAKQRSMQR